MELLVAIDALDDLVHGSRRVPLTAQVRIDEQTLQDAVHRLRAEVTELFGASPGSMGSIAEVVGATGDLQEVVRPSPRSPCSSQA